jgi:hypothetical protein
MQRLTRRMAKYIVVMLGDSDKGMSDRIRLWAFSPRGRTIYDQARDSIIKSAEIAVANLVGLG